MKLDNDFISRFKKNLPAQDENFRRKAYVFLVCLALSVFVWFLIALTKESITSLDYPIVYSNLPDDMTLVNKPDSVLSFRISSGGFELITLKYLSRKHPIEINLSQIIIKPEGNYFTGVFSTADISARFFKEHNFAKAVVSYSPQIIQFRFEPLMWKKVPVFFSSNPSFAPQYRLKGIPRMVPDSVKINGPQQILNKIDRITTSKKNIDNINASVDFTVELINPEPESKLQLNPQQIHVFLDVERFTESTIEVPVTVKQQDVEVKLFPSRVKLTYLVNLENFKRVDPGSFKAVIDLSEDPTESRVKVYIEQQPAFVDITRIEPEKLEYLVIKKQ